MSTDRFSRIFDVLELLAGSPDGLTVTEISTALELPLSSTHNLLHRMVSTHVVSVTDGLRYSIGARAVRLGIRLVDGLEVRTVARRHLQDLARESGEHVYLAVRLGSRVVYVDRLAGTRQVTVHIQLGQSLYLHATAVGKLFAAHDRQLRQRLLKEERPQLTDRTLTDPKDLEGELNRILADGISVSREEAIEGIVGFGIPVYDADENLAAAVHISALRAQVPPERERQLISLASAAAAAIERDLGRVPTTQTSGRTRAAVTGSDGDGHDRQGRSLGARSTAATGSIN